ncbi:hypothetical protein Rsub_10155 [Raphidocelis subcapitata]|uniref:Uncharacterized protein n=1 Tax=Raphidocelis subcapitata TaxID=307507 RepID=A0A2V0PCH4_9CHLO|nr:hypothetical protein Rsub_10155 [Raphidocelis subcapitata]|eukprot:GBF97554.1 hypothetical protein Rsub_10155 [Raphidocelis subcapitata]
MASGGATGLPPRAPTSRKRVLAEDEYTAVIEAVIERDFFPAIPKLQNKLEWLDAVQSGDPAAIRRAQLNIARRRAGLKTPLPGETPAPGGGGGGFTATPGTAARTPAMTPLPRPPTGAATPAPAGGGGADGPGGALEAAAATGARAPKMSLDAFLSRYTGEDNASFEALLEDHNARKRARHAHHLEGKDAPLQLEGPAPTDEYGTSGQSPSTLRLWKFEPKNRLYYDASQQPLLEYSAAERAAMVAGPPKGLRHDATRLAAEVEEAQALALAAAGLADPDAAAALVPGAGAADPAEALAAGAPPPAQHGAPGPGRAYLRTPSVAPGVGASPLVTWGDIAATPLRLAEDFGEDLGALGIDPSAADGPQFRMPQVRRREAAGREAFDKKKAAAAARRRGGGSATPLLDSMRRGAPGTPLSSAAQRLAAQLGKGAPGGGGGGGGGGSGGRGSTGLLSDRSLSQNLRASYGGASGTPSARPRTASATPQLGLTPRLRAAPAPRGSKPGPAPPAAAAAAAAGAPPNAGGSITDDLLKLPPRN